MRNRQVRRVGALAVVVVFAGGLLTACTFSVAGGISALLFAVVVGGGLLFTATSQSGCEVHPCLSIMPEIDAGPDFGIDAKVGPCLSVDQNVKPPDADLSPCLSPDMYVGPCLLPVPDQYVGPCLQPPLPDMPLPKPDMKLPKPDAKVTPCLSPPPEAEPAPPKPHAKSPGYDKEDTLARRRQKAVSKFAKRLPPELAERLGQDDSDG